MKRYNLNIKNVLIILLITLFTWAGCIYFTFYSTFSEKLNMLAISLINKIPPGCFYFGWITLFPLLIYMFELLIYKRKDVLIIDDKKIEFYCPTYGKLEIYTNTINDLYIADNKLNIICNNLNYKKNIRTKLWLPCLIIFNCSKINKNVLTINLKFINCDIEALRKIIILLDKDSIEANNIINNKLKEYKITNIEQLKTNNKVLSECIIDIYKLENLTQQEIATLLDISVNKVSREIKEYLNKI